jgi:hypothetical protein
LLPPITQAQFTAQRLFDEVCRQQVRTQMVINDALMLCSPAFSAVAANIKTACVSCWAIMLLRLA